MITEPLEPSDVIKQPNVFGRVILRKLVLKKVTTVLTFSEMVIELIIVLGQGFGYDWMANGVTVVGSSLSTFVRNIFVDLFTD